MPLPNAPSPKDSNVYKQLSSESLGTTSKDNFDIVNDPVFIDFSSEDELRRLNLVGQASNMQSQSGPIPGTAKIVTVAAAASGSMATVFQPDEGQVWRLIDITVVWTGNSGTISASPVLQDSANSKQIFVGRQAATTAHHEFPNIPQDSLYITNEVFLRGWSAGTFTSGEWAAAVIRVR